MASFGQEWLLIRIEWLAWPLVQHMLGCLIPVLAAGPSAQPRLAARFEIGWQPHYPDTLLFLTLEHSASPGSEIID